MLPLLLSLLSKIGPMLLGPVTQFFTGINIGQVLQDTFSVIQKYWKLFIVLSLFLGNLILGFGWSHDHNLLTAERTSHQLDVKNFKQAQAQADKNAKEERNQIVKESVVKANATDQHYRDLLNQYNANLLRYKAGQGKSGTISNQGDNSASQTAKSSDGPSSGSQLYITLEDAKICTVNTARLQAAHDWAISLGNSNGN